ncbi:hypothetical protein L914_02064 [Phytophthora nicotianae]|uniref:Uncharacterized protein n=1 Tax=Phytophthora nicotianae TaxID=4792 RepID=W2P1Q5_PHYNI|nr:hypothetical protein L914_02064 [Phytophthora nicotianae]
MPLRWHSAHLEGGRCDSNPFPCTSDPTGALLLWVSVTCSKRNGLHVGQWA